MSALRRLYSRLDGRSYMVVHVCFISGTCPHLESCKVDLQNTIYIHRPVHMHDIYTVATIVTIVTVCKKIVFKNTDLSKQISQGTKRP